MSQKPTRKSMESAIEQYGQRFDMLPPLFYIGYLSDADFIALIQAALLTGQPIAVDNLDGIADQGILL